MQRGKVLDPRLTPSAKILKEIQASGMSFAEYGLTLAKKHKIAGRAILLTQNYNARMRALSRASWARAARREAHDAWILNGYEHLELSTQVLIRAAQKRRVDVEIIDAELSVIELTRGEKREVVKQATITRYDNYLSYELMNHKSLTKTFLARAGVSVPRGGYFTAAHEAIEYCRKHRNIALVVKPASTNF